MEHKSFSVDVKADGDAGTFEATVAVFGNVDKGGDRILPGAFAKSLERWRASGDPIPIILSHQHENPMAHIGVADPNDVTETSKGLLVKGKLDVADNEVAKQVHRLMKRRSLKEFSFGYTVPRGGEKRANGANELSIVDLIEAGPTLKGMNPDTELHAVKSALEGESAEDLRKRAETVEREAVESGFPEVPADSEAKAALEDAEAEIQRLNVALRETQEQLERAQAPSAEELRRRAVRVEREAEESQFPKAALEAPSAPAPIRPGASSTEDSAGYLATMLALAQRFIDAEDDPEDAAAMRDVLDVLQALLNEETTEGDDTSESDGKRLFVRQVSLDEMAGVKSGDIKAVWSTAYVNNLPDSAFLYVESGEKDSEGKTTPRSLRHFPYKDASGSVDLPHLRNALARIPQSNLPQAVKDRLTARAQRILDSQKADVTGRDPKRVRSVDPLRSRADAVELEFVSDGESLRKSPPKVEQPKPELMPLVELKRRMRDEMLTLLSGGIEDEQVREAQERD